MTVIRPNSISGINSITAQGGDINLFRADGTKADIPVVNNITAGVITATTGTFTGNLNVAGVLTYEDVTNVDSVGVITARQGIRIGAGKSIGSDGAAVVYYGDGSNLTGAGPTLTNGADNRVVTTTGASAITGEANLTFNGGATGDAQLTVHAEQNDSGADSELILETSNDFATSVIMFKDSTAEAGSVAYNHGDNYIKLSTNGTNGGTERLRIANNGVRSFATFVDTSYHANPDPLGDGSGIVYYRLNDNFHDSGKFAQHATGQEGGDPTFALVNSTGEKCWNNPTDGGIIIPNLKNSYPFSMAAWINVSSWPTSADNDVIMNLSVGGQRVTLCICCWSAVPSDGADFYIMYGGTGHHYFRPTSKPTNTWIHVVYSVVGSNNTAHRVYQNGADLTTRGNRGGNHGGGAGWRLGSATGSNTERFAIGRIGSIRFFNKALTASEANTLYTNDTFYTG